jgi:hypothetical protein
MDQDDLRPPANHGSSPPVASLIVAGVLLGAVGDLLLRAQGPPGLNLAVWVASVVVAALVLRRRARGTAAGLSPDRERTGWLILAAVFAAGLAWRDSWSLKPLAVGCVTVAFALAAYRVDAAWVRSAGVVRYGVAWACGALHAWTGSVLVLLAAGRSSRADVSRIAGWRQATAVARGLVIATPPMVVFGTLLMSADEVFATMVVNAVRIDAIDVELLASHLILFGVSAWLATGYLRGFLAGTELPGLEVLWPDAVLTGPSPRRVALGITEVATAMAALDLLFLAFVIVQFRYLFGGDTLVQLTPDLTYAEYARQGFFELVFAAFLVVPVLLVADWLLERRQGRDGIVFCVLAGVQIALVLAIAASAFQRLRLYHDSYGVTDSRFYAMVLLIWIGAMLLWFAATVLRGQRRSFAFGALISGVSTVALLFVVNPDAIIARTNVERIASAEAPVRFDVTYATTLSADAVPVLIDALAGLPQDVQCPLARHMLQRWAPDQESSIRNWSWSAARARALVREHESRLRSMVGPAQRCPAPVAG